jgi:hypothetical protein
MTDTTSGWKYKHIKWINAENIYKRKQGVFRKTLESQYPWAEFWGIIRILSLGRGLAEYNRNRVRQVKKERLKL